MKPEVVDRIVAAYGLEIRRVLEPNSGYRSQVWPIITKDAQQLLVILYKNEKNIVSRIRLANAVGDYLASNEMPTRKTADPRIIKLCSEVVSRYVSVYHYLTGTTIPWESYTMNHLKLLGWAMSDMHYYLGQAPFSLPSVTKEYRQIASRMHVYFARPMVRAALRHKLGLGITKIDGFAQVLNDCDKLSIQHALHMDFVRGNVLFHVSGTGNSRYTLGRHSLSGILDFEKAAYGPPIVDTARTLAFLLVDCKYKTENKIRKYFLESGYNKRGQSTYAENTKQCEPTNQNELLESLMDLFLMYDFYKFLRHNPYEALENNEHFQRTKVLLIKRGLLTNEDDKIS